MDKSDIMNFAPQSWVKSTEVGTFFISPNSEEFIDVEYDLLKAIQTAKRVIFLERIQNVYDFGQFLMRSQIVAISNKDKPVYKVRRYVAIPEDLKYLALNHNLDHRRLDMAEILFKSHLDGLRRNGLIFIVQILTDDPRKREISPYNFTEYYIEYIAKMEYF